MVMTKVHSLRCDLKTKHINRGCKLNTFYYQGTGKGINIFCNIYFTFCHTISQVAHKAREYFAELNTYNYVT